MSLFPANSNQSQVNYGTDASSPIPATPIEMYPPLSHDPMPSAFMSYPYSVGFSFGIPSPIWPNCRVFICSYEYGIHQPVAANHYNPINSGTAASASFPGLLNDGSRNINSIINQQNVFAFGSLGPWTPSVPYVGAQASYNYELGPSTVAPRVASISLGEQRRPREEPQVQVTTDQAADSVEIMHELVARENTRRVHKCPECGREFKSGPALGGHMSHHARRRREEQERRITETNP